MYEARGAAYQKWLEDTDASAFVDATDEQDLATRAFNAGWNARKELDIKQRHYSDGVIEKFIPADGSKIVEHITIEMPENA